MALVAPLERVEGGVEGIVLEDGSGETGSRTLLAPPPGQGVAGRLGGEGVGRVAMAVALVAGLIVVMMG